MYHIDAKTVFLNPFLKEIVFIAQPKGFKQGNQMCRLLKALYSLKQAPREWYSEINEYLQSIGFINSTSNPNLYLAPGLILILFVDDMLIFARNTTLLKDLKEQLARKYQMSDLGEVRQFLGLQIY